MPYTLKKTNGTTLAVIQDGSIDNSTDLVFVGKNYAGYGQTVNENFLKLLENFSSPRQPDAPLTGQLWYDSATSQQKLKFYDGTRFKSLTMTDIASKRPSDLKAGDQWFDNINQKLYVYNGTDYIMIGPEKTAAQLQSTISTTSVVPSPSGASKTVLAVNIGDSTTAVFSPEAFAVDSADLLSSGHNFETVGRGITLPGTIAWSGTLADNTNLAVRTNAYIPSQSNAWTLRGAASASWGMIQIQNGNYVYYDAASYVRKTQFGEFDAAFITSDPNGVYVNNVIKLHVTDNVDGNLSNFNYSKIKFNVNTGTGLMNVITITTNTNEVLLVQPNPIKNVDLGTETSRFRNGYFKNLYAGTLTTSTTGIISGTWILSAGSTIQGGTVQATTSTTATNAITLQSSTSTTSYVYAKENETPYSIAQRDAVGYLTASGINASSTGTSKVQGTWVIDSSGSFQATTLLGAGTTGYVSASQAFSNNSIVQRTGTGGINAASLNSAYLNAGATESSLGYITGQWSLVGTSTLEATYADIAERYEADAIYEPGTVLIVGGTKEVTVASLHGDVRVAGIVSTNPAFKLNAGAGSDDTHPYIALKGRVPCKVTGWIKKGNRLVTSQKSGYAEAFREGDDISAVIGIALSDKETSGDGIIEVLVK